MSVSPIAYASIDPLLTLAEITEITSLSRATIYRSIACGEFPAPVKIGRLSRWRASDVQNYLDALAEWQSEVAMCARNEA